MLLALPLVFWACNDSKEVDEVKEPVLTLTSAETLEFSAEAATGEISYKLENPVEGQAVAATADVDWINNFQYGEKVTFAVEANEATEAREGKVTVTYTTLSFEVTVKQAGKTLKPEVVVVAGEAAEFEAEGGNGVIEYELKNAAEGVELKATCEAAWVKAVTVVAADSKVTYTVEANADAQSRNATIVLTYGESKAEATVKQKPFVEEGKSALDLKSEGTAKFTAEGGNGVVKFEVINSKEGVKTEAKCEAAWISGLAVNEANTELAYTVAANNTFEARKATIVITYGEAKLEVAVEQEAHAKPELKITANAVKEFTAEGGNGEFTYELKNAVEGTQLAVECKAEWIKATLDEKNSKVTYTVAANEGEAREAIITLAYGELKAEALVKQVAKGEELKPVITVKAEDAVKEFEAEGGNGEASFTLENAAEGAQVEAKADEAATWISVVAVANNKVTYTVAANETDKAREAKITLTCGEAKAEITVKQKAAAGPVFEQKPAKPEVSVKAAGGEGAIGYKLENPIKGVEVAATADVDWLTISEIDTEKCRITYYASETETKSERTGHITATYGDLSFVVTLIQDGGTTRLSMADNATTMSVNYTAQTVTIPFDVLFPIEGNEPEATVAYTDGAGWITSLVAKLNEKTPEDEPATANEGATEEISRLSGNVTFEVPEHTTQGDRSATITIKYMDSSVTVNFTQKDNFADDVEYVATGAAANSRTGAQIWDFFLYEQDPTLGEIRTTISIQLPTAHANFIPDGTYSVAAGTIIPGTVKQTGEAINYYDSTYRDNYMGGQSPIKDAEFTIVNNKEAQTAKVEGYFVTQMLTNYESMTWEDVRVTFKWEGAVKNFMYADTTQVVTDWKEVYIQFIEEVNDFTRYIVNGKTKKAAGSMPISFDLFAYQGAYSTTSVPAGRYNVVDFDNKPTDTNYCLSTSKVNNKMLKSGYVLIEDNTDGTQRFYYDVIDEDGSNVRGEYIGAITK